MKTKGDQKRSENIKIKIVNPDTTQNSIKNIYYTSYSGSRKKRIPIGQDLINKFSDRKEVTETRKQSSQELHTHPN